jgi:hypothetical protein
MCPPHPLPPQARHLGLRPEWLRPLAALHPAALHLARLHPAAHLAGLLLGRAWLRPPAPLPRRAVSRRAVSRYRERRARPVWSPPVYQHPRPMLGRDQAPRASAPVDARKPVPRLRRDQLSGSAAMAIEAGRPSDCGNGNVASGLAWEARFPTRRDCADFRLPGCLPVARSRVLDEWARRLRLQPAHREARASDLPDGCLVLGECSGTPVVSAEGYDGKKQAPELALDSRPLSNRRSAPGAPRATFCFSSHTPFVGPLNPVRAPISACWQRSHSSSGWIRFPARKPDLRVGRGLRRQLRWCLYRLSRSEGFAGSRDFFPPSWRSLAKNDRILQESSLHQFIRVGSAGTLHFSAG